MDLNFAAFQEPRGVMRILHLFFSIVAFATVTDFDGNIKFSYNDPTNNKTSTYNFKYGYPFDVHQNITGEDFKTPVKDCQFSIIFDFSSDAQFFVATGVLAMLIALAIIILYAKFDTLYKSNHQVRLTDFILTVIFSVLWLSSSAAWANGLSHLKDFTDSHNIDCNCVCTKTTGGYSNLNVSVVLGFLNFFLWAADLWFVYKETSWFRGSLENNSGV